ncbi:hypothetical protein [uncultured Desulfovibrio sp.]|uniref:hypothetical protein n=1 Tax=uncultured Desulfovibrio sp. TaxID=167968 RepID=UPI00262137A9|nr:hypothetical protein [uncultured Desulfovibrio sp.]
METIDELLHRDKALESTWNAYLEFLEDPALTPEQAEAFMDRLEQGRMPNSATAHDTCMCGRTGSFVSIARKTRPPHGFRAACTVQGTTAMTGTC